MTAKELIEALQALSPEEQQYKIWFNQDSGGQAKSVCGIEVIVTKTLTIVEILGE